VTEDADHIIIKEEAPGGAKKPYATIICRVWSQCFYIDNQVARGKREMVKKGQLLPMAPTITANCHRDKTLSWLSFLGKDRTSKMRLLFLKN
jgi:hypothetical protein